MAATYHISVTLAQATTTTGQSAWDKYVQAGNVYKDISYYTYIDTAVYDSTTGKKSLLNVKAGTELTITNKDKVVKQVDNKDVPFASVKVGTKTGLMPVRDIRKPTLRNTALGPTFFGLLGDMVKSGKYGSFSLNEAAKSEAEEKKYIESINKYIASDDGAAPVDLRVDNGSTTVTVPRVVGATKAPAGSKADIILVSLESGRLVSKLFISHKKAGGALGFQQYSGTSERAAEEIYKNEVYQKFLKDLGESIGDTKVGKGYAAYRLIPNDTDGKKLAGMAIFGDKFGDVSYGPNNCNFVAQGDAEISSNNLTASEEVHPGNVSWAFNNDGYRAVIGVTYRSDRTVTINGIKQPLRAGIYPRAYFTQRKNVTII